MHLLSYQARGLLAALALGLVAAPPAAAQRSFYRVYQYEQPLKGWLEATLWTTVVPSSHLAYEHFGEGLTRNGLSAHSLEFEYGLTDQSTLGVYLNAENPGGAGLQVSQFQAVYRYRLARRYAHFLNTSFYLGYIVPRHRYDNTQEVEVRTVLEHDFTDFRVVLNPTLSQAISGEEARFWPTALLDGAVYYRRYFHVQPGVELYNNFGELGSFRQPRHHQVFTTLDLRGLGFDLNLGLGLPLTPNDDRLVVKALLVYSLGVVRPELLFHRGQRSTANQ
ncbi:MAG: hypothetical protein ACRYFK_15945 [Janthinobacterium lividum]